MLVFVLVIHFCLRVRLVSRGTLIHLSLEGSVWWDAKFYPNVMDCSEKDPKNITDIACIFGKTFQVSSSQIFPHNLLLLSQGGLLPNKEVGGILDLTSSLEAKFGARSSQAHQIRGKIWEVLSPQDAKVGEKSQFWGHIWNTEGKIWGICHLYFWRQNWDSIKNFRGKFWGQAPRPPNMKVSPLGLLYSIYIQCPTPKVHIYTKIRKNLLPFSISHPWRKRFDRNVGLTPHIFRSESPS